MKKTLPSALRLAYHRVFDHEYDKRLSARLCAVITVGGSIVSTGHNKMASNSFVEQYARDACRPFTNMHAEMAAVQAALRQASPEKLVGAKIFVARTLRNAEAMARPCRLCEQMLRRHGVKRAYYTIDAHHYGVMSIGTSLTTDKIVRINGDVESEEVVVGMCDLNHHESCRGKAAS